jgi:hypothetical protein
MYMHMATTALQNTLEHIVVPQLRSILLQVVKDYLIQTYRQSETKAASDPGFRSLMRAIEQTLDTNLRTLTGNLLNLLFTSDLTAGLVGWQHQPADKMNEANTPSKLMLAMMMRNALQTVGISEITREHAEVLWTWLAFTKSEPCEVASRLPLEGNQVPPPGSHIYYTFAFHEGVPTRAEHHGVMLRDGKVVEVVNRLFKGKDGQPTVKSIVTLSTFESFQNRAVNNQSKIYHITYNTSCGRIADVAKRARWCLGRWDYHLVFQNCEHAATWIATGSFQSAQCNAFMARGRTRPSSRSALSKSDGQKSRVTKRTRV